MQVTVAICTWNRCKILRQSLDHMTRLMIPNHVDWELLLINNSCTDGTDAVAEDFARRLPLRYLKEPRPGLSLARNAAVHEAKGDYILWTDDDALVGERWIASYVEAFVRWPEAVFFGGPILPFFAVTPPTWLVAAWPRLKGAYAERNLGSDPLPLMHEYELPFGANYAVRMAEQRSHLYDPKLGHRLAARIGGEETALLSALMAAGGVGWWVPGATVQHLVPPERLTARYVRRYFFWHGRYLQVQESRKKADPSLADKLRSLWWRFSRAMQAEALCQRRRWRQCRPPWGHHLTEASIEWGRFVEACSVAVSRIGQSREQQNEAIRPR